MGGDLQSPPMVSARIATVLVGVLIAASAVAFLRAEHLKLERSPVAKPSIQKFFSATCIAGTRHCSPSHRAALSFTLRRPATVALAIVDGDGHVVRTAERPGRAPQGRRSGRRGTGAPPRASSRPTATTTCASTCGRSTGRSRSPTRWCSTTRRRWSPSRARPATTPVRYGVSERARVWAVARIANYTGPGDAPRASFRGRNGVVHFKPSRKIPPGTPIDLVLVALDAAGNSSTIVPVTGLHMPAL